MTTSILIVDSQPIVRLGLTFLFSRQGFNVCGTTGSYGEAVDLFRQRRPDVVIVDLIVPGGSGLGLIRELSELNPKSSVIVFSDQPETLFADRALRAGAKGYVAKTETPDRILAAARCVLDGRIYLSEQMADRMLRHSIDGNGEATVSPVGKLSDRELEVFEQLGRGTTTRTIAANLGLSPKTVETYRENIKVKLRLKNAVELTQHAVQWVLERQTKG